jgi:hypothetical protein
MKPQHAVDVAVGHFTQTVLVMVAKRRNCVNSTFWMSNPALQRQPIHFAVAAS